MSPSEHRPRGRRVAIKLEPGRWRPGDLLPVLVVISFAAGALLLAGTTTQPIGATSTSSPGVARNERTFSCTGGVPGGSQMHGSGGRVRIGKLSSTPFRFIAPSNKAPGAFATQTARTGRSFALLPCPEPRRAWWFVGVGGSVTHGSVLTIDNPRPGSAVVSIDVFGPKGPIEGPGLHGLTIAGGATKTFDLSRVAPAVGNLALRVLSTRGLVSASVSDSYAPPGIRQALREWVAPQPSATRDLTLVGLPPKPNQATLMVVNPGAVSAVAELEVIGAGGRFSPKGFESITVPPASVARLNLRSVFDTRPAALRLTANHPIAAGLRMLVGKGTGDLAYAARGGLLNGTTAFALPNGGGQLVLSTVDAEASIGLTIFSNAGKVLTRRTLAVPAQTSRAVPLPPRTGYLRLVSDQPRARAGVIVTTRSGIATVAVPSALRATRLPVVALDW